MIEKVHEVNDAASNMAAITEEQSASAEEIFSENSADVQKDSKEMENTAETLKEHISRFTI